VQPIFASQTCDNWILFLLIRPFAKPCEENGVRRQIQLSSSVDLPQKLVHKHVPTSGFGDLTGCHIVSFMYELPQVALIELRFNLMSKVVLLLISRFQRLLMFADESKSSSCRYKCLVPIPASTLRHFMFCFFQVVATFGNVTHFLALLHPFITLNAHKQSCYLISCLLKILLCVAHTLCANIIVERTLAETEWPNVGETKRIKTLSLVEIDNHCWNQWRDFDKKEKNSQQNSILVRFGVGAFFLAQRFLKKRVFLVSLIWSLMACVLLLLVHIERRMVVVKVTTPLLPWPLSLVLKIP
jgi:hypothetical protein